MDMDVEMHGVHRVDVGDPVGGTLQAGWRCPWLPAQQPHSHRVVINVI